MARIGRGSIEALELGNEPELYASFGWYATRGGIRVPGARRGTTSPPTRRLREDQRGPTGRSARRTSSGTSNWIAHVERSCRPSRGSVATVHRYPLQRCYLPPPRVYPSIAHLLSPAASQGSPTASPRSSRPPTRGRGAPRRRDELGLLRRRPGRQRRLRLRAVGARRHVPDARVGVNGVNFHTFPGARYELFNFKRRGAGTDSSPPSTTASRVCPGRAAWLEPPAPVGFARQREGLGDPRPRRDDPWC